jgi:hypothetical protein
MRRVEAILARFPGPVTLTPSRLRWLALTAGALVFVAICIFLLWARPADFDGSDVLMAGFGIVFFGAGAAVGVLQLMPGAGRLVLTADGFDEIAFYRRVHVPWLAADRFTVSELPEIEQTSWFGRSRSVGYEIAGMTGRLAELNRELTGTGAGLADTTASRARTSSG